MAMSNSGMSAAIKSEIQAIPGINITDEQELEKFCDAIGKAIVEYLKNNAQLNGIVDGGSNWPIVGGII